MKFSTSHTKLLNKWLLITDQEDRTIGTREPHGLKAAVRLDLVALGRRYTAQIENG